MSGHLSSDQISEWVIGERPFEVEEHLNNCAGCRDELALFGTAMSLYRTSVVDWTDENRLPDLQTLRRVKRVPLISAVQSACWAGAAGLLCVVLSMPLLHHVNYNPTGGEAAADTASLLTQVNAQVSEPVPDAMEPLTRLVQPYQRSSSLQ